MKRLLLITLLIFGSQGISLGQCPDGNNTDTDGDGVVDCIDPCINQPNSIIGNLDFESDFVGWTIPMNSGFFNINQDPTHILYGDNSLLVTAPSASVFENHAIYSEEFVLQQGVPYNFTIPVKRIGSADGDALRWVLIDENGVYRHFNNYYSFTEDWTMISFNDFQVDFTNYSSNKFRLRFEFGLSTTDMVVDKIEFYESAQGFDPAYLDYDNNGIPDCESFDASNHPDYNALMDFYTGTNGPNWTNNTNWLDTSVPISSWYGITETNGRITGINLNSNGLNGTIPESFSDLTELESFSIRLNSVFGSFPLATFNNQTKLQYVDINSNFMSGFIPPEISNLTDLWYLDIGWNSFDGTIPSEITNLSNLQYAYLHNNQLTGGIPSGPGTLPSLQVLYMANNNLTGIIPDLSALPALTYFDVTGNQFIFADLEPNYVALNASLGANFVYDPQQWIDQPRGVAANIGETVNLTSIPDLGTDVIVYWYKFDGVNYTYLGVGETFGITVSTAVDYDDYIYYVTSPTITGLGLQSHPITIGPDPSEHPDYDALVAIYNALDGPNWDNPWDITAPIETWDTSYRLQFDPVTNRVTDIEYTGAGLSGTIPSEIEDLTELKRLWFFGNDIVGEIPAEIWNLTNLTELVIGSQDSGSAFTPGSMTLTNGIPAEISNLQQLEWLNLNGVQLSLPLQPELFNLPSLIRLRLQDCGIIGQLPAGLATIDDVRVDRNEFEGPIPQDILNSTGNLRMALSNNFFDFSDLEPLVQSNNYQFLEYSPQRTRDVAQTIEAEPGQDIVLDVDDTGIGRTNTSTARANIYQWFKDDIAISGAIGSSYTIVNAQESDSGDYYCEITNTILPDLIIRRATISIDIDGTLDIEDEEEDMSFKLYPNPTKDIVDLHFNDQEERTIDLFDLNGRRILSKSSDNRYDKLDLSNLQSGIYLLKIESQSGSMTKRIVKH